MLQRLPPILYRSYPNPISSRSKAPWGLSVLSRVTCIFTGIKISPDLSLRQRPSRYAIRAGQNLPDKEFRYLRTVIVTAAVYWGFGSQLRIAPNRPLTFQHRAGVSPYTSPYGFAQTCVLLNSRLGLFTAAPRAIHPTEAPLLPKLRGHFAEFLNESSSARLRILFSPTCVGLRYGHLHLTRGFSWQCEIMTFATIIFTPHHSPALSMCGFAYTSASLLGRTSISPRHYPPASPHRS